MGAISAWVRGIVLLVLAVTFLEMLVPRSDLKKFVDMIMGLAVIGAMIAPIVNIGLGYAENGLALTSTFALPDASKRTGMQMAAEAWDGQEIASNLTETVIETRVREALSTSFAESGCSWEVEALVDRDGRLLSIMVDVCDGSGDLGGRTRPSDFAIVANVSTLLGVNPGTVIVRQGGQR